MQILTCANDIRYTCHVLAMMGFLCVCVCTIVAQTSHHMHSFRDQLHQTGQRAAGGRGPAEGHACCGWHEAPDQRPARTFRACCHSRLPHRTDFPPEKQEKQSVSKNCPVWQIPIHYPSIESAAFLCFFFLSALKNAQIKPIWQLWCRQWEQKDRVSSRHVGTNSLGGKLHEGVVLKLLSSPALSSNLGVKAELWSR